MFNLKLSNIKVLSFSILVLCLISVGNDITFQNKIFWVILTITSIFLLKIKIRFKTIIIAIYAITGLFVQLRLNLYILSEEFFLNCLGVLLIAKYSEIQTKNNQLNFNLIAMIIAVASLIKGQDLFSSFLSLTILITLVVNMYLIQQQEILDFNIKNVLKYLGFGLSIFPFIIFFYLIFPRAEISFRLFDPSANTLGIPDNINLGSFKEFSNSEDPVFALINKGYNKEELYFRVKIFDYMQKNKSWTPTSSYYMYNTFKNHFKIKQDKIAQKTHEIILEPHKGKWIPSLANSLILNKDTKITQNLFDQTFSYKDPIDRKRKITFIDYQPIIVMDKAIKDYYTLLPETISPELKKWVEINKKEKTKKEFLNFILQTFSNGSYYYNLSPENISNNSYADFFLKNKEGYCEYFAGTFVILARLANIPSRVVSGYLGGDLNDIGDFYSFKQKDAHAWSEVWIDDLGWVRVDPTKAIPPENVRNSLNDVFQGTNVASKYFIDLKILKRLGYYINYADFVWTQHLLSYDNDSRQSFVNDLLNFKFSKLFIWIFAPILIFIFIRFIFLINKHNFISLLIKFIIWKSKKNTSVLKSDTHQQIFNKLSIEDQNKYKNFFNLFELIKYNDQNINYSKIIKSLI